MGTAKGNTPIFIYRRILGLRGSRLGDIKREISRHLPGHPFKLILSPGIDVDPLITSELNKAASDVCLLNIGPGESVTALAGRDLLAPLDRMISADAWMKLHELGLRKNMYREKIYGIQTNISIGLLYGRQDILFPYHFPVPLTCEDLILQASEVLAHEKTPLVGFCFRGKGELAKCFLEYLWSNGGSLFNKDGEVSVPSVPAEETLDFFLRLIYKNKLMPLAFINKTRGFLRNEFVEKRTLFFQSSSDLLASRAVYRTNFKKNILFASTPCGPSGKIHAGYPEGSYFAVPANTRYPDMAKLLLVFFTDPGKSWKFEKQWVYPFSRFKLTYDEIGTLYPEFIKNVYPFFAECQVPASDLPIHPEVYNCIERNLVACLTKELSPTAALQRMAQEIETVTQRKIFSPPIERAVEYIKGHYTEPIPLGDLAMQVGLERHYFSRLFSESTGNSPLRFIQNLRLKCAKRLLVETNLPLNAIAEQSGFVNLALFHRLFKRLTGKTPKHYREQEKKSHDRIS